MWHGSLPFWWNVHFLWHNWWKRMGNGVAFKMCCFHPCCLLVELNYCVSVSLGAWKAEVKGIKHAEAVNPLTQSGPDLLTPPVQMRWGPGRCCRPQLGPFHIRTAAMKNHSSSKKERQSAKKRLQTEWKRNYSSGYLIFHIIWSFWGDSHLWGKGWLPESGSTAPFSSILGFRSEILFRNSRTPAGISDKCNRRIK